MKWWHSGSFAYFCDVQLSQYLWLSQRPISASSGSAMPAACLYLSLQVWTGRCGIVSVTWSKTQKGLYSCSNCMQWVLGNFQYGSNLRMPHILWLQTLLWHYMKENEIIRLIYNSKTCRLDLLWFCVPGDLSYPTLYYEVWCTNMSKSGFPLTWKVRENLKKKWSGKVRTFNRNRRSLF